MTGETFGFSRAYFLLFYGHLVHPQFDNPSLLRYTTRR
jgi:hypothetical protein